MRVKREKEEKETERISEEMVYEGTKQVMYDRYGGIGRDREKYE